MDVRMEPGWKAALDAEFEQPYFTQLREFVRDQYRNHVCYPPGKEVFAAFDHCGLDEVRVVIIGQDPYHGPGQANGLCFSVADGVKIPSSLRNIFKEIHEDLGLPIPSSGNLERWAKQGVLLLNAMLTVRASEASSHRGQGWEQFTDAVVEAVNREREGVVFLLWGSYAQKKGQRVDRDKHFVLSSPHPSGLSAHRGFFGNRHFSQANAYLEDRGQTPIDWS